MLKKQNYEGMLMKSPLWILNSALVALFIITLGLMVVLRAPLPGRRSLTPHAVAPVQHDVSKINITRIYESDLFKTFARPAQQQKKEADLEVRLPQPPQTKILGKRQQPVPEFLPPLDVGLKGVIFNSNSVYSRAIVIDKKTKQEQLYKIGDSIADANLIYIGKNKAIFIRSNGQQETLFISEEDAKNDPIYGTQQEWSTAVEKIDNNNYVINLEPFAKQISNLPQLLNTLDVTTAFEKGKSIGCRIGRMNPQSLGPTLGFEYEDIVVSINGIPTTSTTDRVKIFKEIENLENNGTISVQSLRKGKQQTFTYVVRKRRPKKQLPNPQLKQIPAGTSFDVDNNNIVVNQAQKDMEIAEYTLAQSRKNNRLSDMFKNNDKKAMLNFGGRNAQLKR